MPIFLKAYFAGFGGDYMKNKLRELWWSITSGVELITLVVKTMIKYKMKFLPALTVVEEAMDRSLKNTAREQKRLTAKARKKIRHRVMRHHV